MSKACLIFLELNEVNFDVASRYVEELNLTSFGLLLKRGIIRTSSEQRYEQLEPWIQWVSAHTGLTANEHEVFRLGDIVNTQLPQFFEVVEAAGYRVGAISPMNVRNQLLNPAYFIPDPWTHTPTDNSFWSRHLWLALSQTINDNSSGRITAASAVRLCLAIARFSRPKHYSLYWGLLRKSKGAPWRKALLLDLFLHDLHMRLFQRHKPNFSTLFLNAGAHIQHHYFFNSKHAPGAKITNPSWYVDPKEDPIADMLKVYDTILTDYLTLPNVEFLLATGLTQVPYNHMKFYYRLNNHKQFLDRVGVQYAKVLPRMTRDFVIEFDNEKACNVAHEILSKLRVADDETLVFGEIDNRGLSLFVTLTYPKEVPTGAMLIGPKLTSFELKPQLAFVAIKNGMHADYGYVASTAKVAHLLPEEGAHVKELHSTVLRFFDQKPKQT